MNRRRFLPVLVPAVLALLAGCADDSPQATATQAAAVSTSGVTVEIASLDNSFRPDRIEIEAGTEVVWTNAGRNEHDVFAIDGEGWGVEIEDFEPGAEYRHVFTEPGEYRYICTVHADADVPHIGMVGVVVVTDA